jgi:hypothetical protein
MAEAYIGKVTFKKTGTVLHVLRSKREQEAQRLAAGIQRATDHIKREFEGDLCGYVVVGWDKDGTFLCLPATGDGVIGASILPAFVEGMLRREVARTDARRDLFGIEEEDGPA